MEHKYVVFDEQHAIEHIKHYLPSQAALKDFVHHNTLHGFQHLKFHEALWQASTIFGFRTYLSINEFREHYEKGRIKPEILTKVISEYCIKNQFQQEGIKTWKTKLLTTNYDKEVSTRLFQVRNIWKNKRKFNLDKVVHPWLFRILSAYLDQGISTWTFPTPTFSFLDALQSLESNNYVSLFKSNRVRKIFLERNTSIGELLKLVVGNEAFFEQYLFDQQFSHPGWSGFIGVLETQPETLLKSKSINLKDLIFFELLLEIDALDDKFGSNWEPLYPSFDEVSPLFAEIETHELSIVLRLWQEAFEWSYFDGILSGILSSNTKDKRFQKNYQGLFCIDDREYSFRRHLEIVDPSFETFGTPGFFGIEFYFQPENGKFYTKACPAPVTPKTLIKETNRRKSRKNDIHFNEHSHSLIRGGLISSTIGFWAAMKLFLNLFRPSLGPITAYSFAHMDKHSDLQIDYDGMSPDGLKIGFTNEEMALRVGNVLKSIGLISNFAPIVYIVGHGGSSVNNPYYAGYDCGACCGRPGAINARVFAYMANKKDVREILMQNDINIPEQTTFIGAMHDTTRDEIDFYDEDSLDQDLLIKHKEAKQNFQKALLQNAEERSYRFDTLNSKLPIDKLHKEIKKRSVSIFEPRPEWNHTDNALCIIGRKEIYNNLYLDKRPFINSYDYATDPEGKYLSAILNAAIPVCGGINLEYYFSRVDQQSLGSGTKLPHNIVGLFAVNTGIDGDLRTGLPSQMIEIHDAIRILFIIEHTPEVVLKTIQANPSIYEWIKNEWVLMSVKNPINHKVYRFYNDNFQIYEPTYQVSNATNFSDYLHVIMKNEPVVFTNNN